MPHHIHTRDNPHDNPHDNPPPHIHVHRGDAFVARARETGDEYERISFGLSDLHSGPRWLDDARRWNEKKREGEGERERDLMKRVAKDAKLCDRADCDKAGTLRCGRCKKGKYCSKECQREDWKYHKANCMENK